MRFEFERVSPESVGIPTEAIEAFLNKLEEEENETHSVMLLRHGKVCFEKWWAPETPDSLHSMWSFSKSLTSTAIGFAVQEGSLKLSDKLIDIFPDKLPETVSKNLEKCTVRDLLTMSCGHETEPDWHNKEDWIGDFLAHEFKYEPGTMFQYNTDGTNMLCAILAEKTGEQLTAYLRPRLLDPLGIGEIEMRVLPDGTEMGGAGYKLRTEDMARFMQFVLDRGKWQGEQLLNESWFDLATTKQIETANTIYNPDRRTPDWSVGYCFQYWICQPEGVFRADGMYGQFGIAMPKKDALLIITEHSSNTQMVLDAVWDLLYPAIPED